MFCWFCVWLLLSVWHDITCIQDTNKSTSHGISKGQTIVDEILRTYDGRVSPSDALENGAVEVSVQLYILSLDSSDESTDFTMNFFLRQRWRDERLAHNESGLPVLELHHLAINEVWLPDIYFVNEKTAHFHYVSVPNKMFNVFPDGRVSYSVRVTGTFTCEMDLRKFPLDKQTCFVKIESYGHSTRSLKIRWKSPAVILSKNIKMTLFSIKDTVPFICDQQYMEYNYSCIGINFHLTRMNGFYFIHMYVPSILIVMLSWISFWLDIEATAARVSLGILTVLAMTTQNKNTGVQQVSYVTAMNVWTAASLAFVFLGVIEFAYINVKTRKHVRNSINKSPSTISMNSSNTHMNGSVYSFPKSEPKSPQRSQSKYTLTSIIDVDNRSGRRVDRYARIAFPVCYLLFNICYWSFYVMWEPDQNLQLSH
ncbi:glycine receptor subunit alpha-1-like isoform X1 [Crassostrea virginica]